MSTHRGMEKEPEASTYNGIFFNLRKEGYSAMYNNVDRH